MSVIPVEIWQIMRDEEGHDVVFLRDDQGRLLPIIIGSCEAAAIWVRLAPELAAPFVRRPWTHDFMVSMLERLSATLERVVIDNVVNGTYYATLHLQYRDAEIVVDARPSDAIALVLRMPAALGVEDEVMRQKSFLPGSEGPESGEHDENNGFGDWP